MRQKGPTGIDNTVQVDIDYPIPVLLRHILKGRVYGDTRIIKYQIQLTVLIDDLCRQAINGRFVRDIEHMAGNFYRIGFDHCLGLSQSGWVDFADSNIGAGFCQ